jgi:hypothetical protein
MAQDTSQERGAAAPKRIYSDAELGFGASGTGAQPTSAPKVYADAELGFAPQAPSLGRSVGDSAIALGTGVAQGVKMVSDAFGANNAVSRLMGKGIQAAEGLESDYRKAEKQERARKIKAAEDSGSTWEEVKAYAGSMVDAPLDTTLNAVGSVVPTLAAAALTGGGSAAAQLAARAAPLAIGAVQGAGAVKGGIYDAVEQRHLEAGATPEQAAERAGAAQAYTGDNLGSIAAGAGLGMLAGSTGAEAAVRRLARVGAAKQAADASAVGIAKGAALGAAKEAPMEAVQGGQERLAANLAEQGEGFDTPTMRGVLGQAALEGMAAAPLGGGLGAVEASGRAGRADPAAARHNAEAAAQDAQAKTDAQLADDAMVADAQLQAQQRAQELAEQEAGAPEVPQTPPPDGAAALRAQQEAAAAARQQALEISRAVQEPDDEILQSTGQAEPVRPSEAMGLRADAGGLESVAAMAVDAGLTEQLQAQTAAQQPEAQQKQEQSAQDQQGINAEKGEVSGAMREQQIRERLDFLGQQGRAQGWSAEAVAQRDALQQELDLLSPGQRIEQLNAQADAAAAEATDWAGRQYKPNPQELPEHAAQGGPADVGEANEQRRLKKVVQAKGEEASARAQADALQAQGNAAAQLAAKHDLAALRRKKTDEMSTEELQALAADLGPRHVRAKRLQQAIAEREAQLQPAINQGVNDGGPQTDQTQQASPQQPQAGAAPGLAIDSGAPAAGAQAAQLIAQEGNQRREAEQQRKLDASERWTRMTTVERQAAAEQAPGLNAVAKKNLHNRAWADISEKNRKALLDVVVPQAEAASDMQAFAPETGTLGIPRDQMPQVPTQSHGGLVKHLNAQGIAHETTTVDAAALKPTQAEYSPSKVAQAKQATGGRAVIVSNDGHIIDGHHQAMAAAEDGKPVKAIVLDAPVEQALEAVKASPSVQNSALMQEAPPAPDGAGNLPLFSSRSTAPKTQLALERVQQMVETALADIPGTPPVHVVRGPADLGLVVAGEDVHSGVTLRSGDIYVFQSGVGSELDVLKTVFHELFHRGLRNILPADQYVQTMLDLAKRDNRVQSNANAWKRLPIAAEQRAELAKLGFAGSELQARYEALAIEEGLAVVAEELKAERQAGTRSVRLRALAGWVAGIADKLGLQRVGHAIRRMSYNEAERFVLSAIEASGQAVATSAQPPASFRRAGTGTPQEFDVPGFLKAMNQGRPDVTEHARAQAVQRVQATADAIRKAWVNGPEVVVAYDMTDPAIPAAVRQADLQQRSGGASGDPEGFYYQGKAYLLASRLQTPNDAARVLFHESLGHHGLRGAFGKALDGILDEIATVRQADVDAKIQEYGLRGGKALDRRIAAEEVLAEMAQSQPQIGFVKRAVAAIRAWLRAHVPGFNNLKVSDAELIRNYILPARAWVERGGLPALAQSDVGFSRSAMKSVDANVARGRRAMQKVLLDKADQHRAMFRNGLGWVDFTWGDSKRGVAHIIKRRMESDGMSLEDVQRMLLDKVVETIATGTEVRRAESGLATRLVLDHNGNEAVLVKRKGANGWLLTAYEMVPGASAGGATRPSATQSSATRSRDELGAGTPTILKKNKDVGKKDATQAQNAKPLGERTGPSAPTVKDSSPYPRSQSGESSLPPASQNDNDAPMFSRSKLADLKTKGLELAHNAMTHPGKVSLWDKTVGTMRHIAQRYPAFMPVFESAQQFIDDVSSVANEAAQMAPRLIPRVESLGDLAKKPISVADNQAIGKALFAGTLDWGRDQHGKAMPMEALRAKYRGLTTEQKAEVLLAAKKIEPQMLAALRGKKLEQFDTLINNKFESTMLKAGAAFNHTELKEFFGLNDQQISLYDEARATVDKSLDITARAEMLRTLGRDWDGMREIVMDAPTLTEAWQLLDDELEQRAKQHPDTRDRQATLMQQLSTTVAKAKELMDHGYMPLQRFGKYTVDVVDAAGERVYFGMFESKAESHRMARSMEREYPGAVVTQGTINDQQFKLFAGITPETAELFGAMLGLDAEGNQAKDQAFQEYLKLAKNNHSAMKRLIHRKGIAGYSEDVGRVLASFVYSNARAAATGLNAGKMEAAIHTLNTEHKDQGELGEIAAKLRSYIQDPQEEGQVIRGMLFAQYLGGSIASAMVNMTQPFAVTMPWLSQYGGMAKAGRFMAGALQDMGKSAMDKGFRYAPDLAHALKMAEDDGVVSPQEIHQLMAQARGAGGLRSGDGTKLGDARAKASNLWEKGKVAWGQPFALAEQFNRRSTFIAAYRLAKDQGMDNPAQFARDAVVETQFLYTKANKPQWARGAIGGTLFTFKTYSVSFLELMQRTWNVGEPGSPERAAGRRAVGWAMLMLMLMGGAGGLPFVEDLEDLIDGAGQAMGYNLSSKQWRQEFMAEWLGQELAGFLEQGLSGLPGAPIDVSGRLGMGNLIPGTGLALSKQSNARDLVEMVGPAGDLIQRGFTGAGNVLKGIATLDAASVGRGALEVMPNAVRNAVKGADMAASGIYKDSKGYKVIDTTLDEAVFKMIGFQPRSVAEVQEANSFMQRSKSFYIQTSNEIRAQWAKALFEKDDAAVAAARARLERWNSLNPDQPIRINMPDVWKRAREMGKDRTQRIAETAPTAIRQQMRAVAQAG